MKENCYDCHSGEDSEAGFDLEKISDDLTDANTDRWVRVFDRVTSGEMPPPDYSVPEDRQSFLRETGNWIKSVQELEFKTSGRVKARRLTNLQLERTLHDLLGIDIPLASLMPEEPRTSGFNTVADGQPMSHFQLQQHLDVVDAALEEAFRRALNKFNGDEFERILPARKIARKNPKRRNREPEMIEGHAVVWSGKLVFYGRTPATTAPTDGWYRFTIHAKGIKVPKDKNVWCTVRSGECFSGAPLMAWVTAFELDENHKQVTFDAWLPKNHRLEIRPGDLTLKRARFRGGQVGTGEGGPQNVAGIAIKSIEMRRIHKGPGDVELRRMLLGDLKIENDKTTDRRAVTSSAPRKDIGALMHRFAQRAFRRPGNAGSIDGYVDLAMDAFGKNEDIVAALRTGYRAILCSPRFLYLQEQAGELDDFAIASRLSYLIWSRMPDKQLLRLASQKKLSNKQVLLRQVDRMLNDPKGKNFVIDLADQWLDLNLIDFTEPDFRLYPGFDVIVQDSMLQETHTFLQTMLDEDLSVSNLIDSDFTFLNSRLARYYGINDVKGDQLQKVSLGKSNRYGGLLTQGAIMKVTANGTATSPVIRGVWVSERLLGQEIPPPPENIPAIEPDIRGAKTIREMLTKHKENGDCAACHRKIDPPGFALEHFDPSGRWRDSYVTRKDKKKSKRPKLPIDSSFVMPDGKPFSGIDEFKKLVLENKNRLAKNVCEKLIVYGTGETVQFADRKTIERCVEQTAKSDFGFRSILKSVITSQIFLTK
ncbi:MAG: DUF1592 domain-containing protein [Mariniblastus sp.]